MSTTLEGVGASEPLLEAARHVGRRLTVPLTATTVTILDGGGVGLHDGLFVQHLEALTLVTTSRFPWASPAPFRGGDCAGAGQGLWRVHLDAPAVLGYRPSPTYQRPPWPSLLVDRGQHVPVRGLI